MAVGDILLLGNPSLYGTSAGVVRSELAGIVDLVADLRDTMTDFRKRHGAGRAIAAPQIGVMKRVVYMDAGEPVVLINPVISDESEEMIEVWDDCMCFPELLVKVLRHCRCRIRYLDLDWKERELELENDLSELLQHECDHLDGILAVMRAIDGISFALKSQRDLL